VGGPSDQERADSGNSRSEIERAQVTGDVVQARDVSGGVHFHGSKDDPQSPQVIPRQLPADVSSFVDRKSEIRALDRLISGRPKSSSTAARPLPVAVVVITGSAGVGKTALALHWAHRIRDRFPDGEIYANLRGYDSGPPSTAEVVLDRILRDLSVPASRIPAELDGRAALFRSLVAERRVLIVLDNVADVSQVRPIIPGAPGPLLVITSRSQLPGLAIRDGAQSVRLDILQESDAVALLRQVTRTGRRRDATADLTELARLCARLPLALRIAAERAVSRPMMQLAELITDLRDDSQLWDALSVGEEPHAEAVRTVFAWSYRDLSEEAAYMFRVLGIHRGPDISLPTAAAAAAVPVRTARRALDILLGAFLVDSIRPGRYQLHDLLRAYALDQARTIDPEDARLHVLDRILRWYIATASQASLLLSPGDRFEVEVAPVDGPDPIRLADAASALEWFDTERPNLVANARAALDAGLRRRAWELAMVLSPIHMQHFIFDDWSVLSEIAVFAAEQMSDQAALASALDYRGKFFFRRRLLDEASAAHSRALSIREQIGDERGICESLNALGLVNLRMRKFTEASHLFERTADRARSIGDPQWDGLGRMNLAETHLESGNPEIAFSVVALLTEFFSSLQDPAYEGNAYWLLSWAQRLLGNYSDALTAITSALQIAERASNRMWEAFWLVEAARVHLASGDNAEAMKCCRMGASLERQIGDASREATALDCAGEVLLATGNAEDAAAFHREAARMHRLAGDPWQEAIALAHLADCEDELDQPEGSREHRAQAFTLIEPFSDNPAARLRDSLHRT
jgi:tetratricopeptide (TPR) repeat protein